MYVCTERERERERACACACESVCVFNSDKETEIAAGLSVSAL